VRCGTTLGAEKSFTRLTVLDTLEVFVNEGSLVLHSKSRRLRVALAALLVATGVFGVGTVLQSL
jgi:hypothetical protein